jgi:hypothetical protein
MNATKLLKALAAAILATASNDPESYCE